MVDKLKELEAARAKLAALEASIADERTAELRALPAKFGFADASAFLKAFTAAVGKRRGRKPGSKNAAPKPAKRTRAKVTDETRAEVKKMVEAEKTGSEIAKDLGISLPTVQNIKKALGLVRKTKKGK